MPSSGQVPIGAAPDKFQIWMERRESWRRQERYDAQGQAVCTEHTAEQYHRPWPFGRPPKLRTRLRIRGQRVPPF